MKNKNGSFVVLFKNDNRDEVFLVYRSDLPIWDLTGGGMEDDELPEKAAHREAEEETGFQVQVIKKLGDYKHIDSSTGELWNKTHLFEGRVISGEFVPEFEGCIGRWFKVSQLPDQVTEITRLRIEDAVVFSGDQYIKEYNFKRRVLRSPEN